MADENDRFYFDTAAVWKFYRDEEGSLNIRRLVSNLSYPVLVSPLTILEFVSVLMKDHRKRYLKQRMVRRIIKRIRRDTAGAIRYFTVIPVDEASYRRAERILLEHGNHYSIGSNDALHLAIVENARSTFRNITFVTSDHSLKNVCEKLVPDQKSFDKCGPPRIAVAACSARMFLINGVGK
ncbi:type II toxin-antitoxin system VapC family toxin [Desulfobacterales bacterium HSG2]|nr:type II toxin-antitoxin system VapC family toxin [Desulfobacterales bacterium HSG2]